MPKKTSLSEDFLNYAHQIFSRNKNILTNQHGLGRRQLRKLRYAGYVKSAYQKDKAGTVRIVWSWDDGGIA